MNYVIDNMGVETYHGPGFSHQLETGFPFWVILHMITPHRVNCGDKNDMQYAEPGTCIIYPPNHPRYLYCPSETEGICNNWIHFSTSDDKAFLQKLTDYQIPPLKFYKLRQTRPVVSTLEEINYEFSLRLPQRDSMLSFMMEALLIRISRDKLDYEAPVDQAALEHLHTFEKLRKELYLHPEKKWTTESMASAAFMAQNRFIILYRTFFETTPRQDIINARIQKAKTILGNTMSIKDVAAQTGFANEYYFSTTFKRIVGIAPGQYIAANKQLNS